MTSDVRERRTEDERASAPRSVPIRRDRTGAFEFDPHHCFACGELNEHGLHLELHTDPQGSWTELTLDSRFQGWDAVAHGGIVCTILDEVMAWSVIGRGTWGVTARLNVAFRRPIPTRRAIRARGWVVEEHRRACRTAGEVLDSATGEVLATAEGTFIAVPEAQLQRLKARYGMRRVNAPRRLSGETTDPGDEKSRRDPFRRDPMSAPALAPERPSAGEHAARILASREARAAELGARLATALHDPSEFAADLASAFRELADPEYRAGQAFVAPGLGPTHGVRTPLQVAVRRAFERASRTTSPSELLVVADRLLREPEREARWFAITSLIRTLGTDAERTWQLLRRAAAEADDWITVDTLAHPFGKGILAEPYRWAELEQLTVSPSRWERRLVGSTIATMPFANRRAGRDPDVAAHSLPLLATLIGDREPDVQKALSWAYRSMAIVDLPATTAALGREASLAVERDDGHRAWVVRDSLPKLEPAEAQRLRDRLAGIRRRTGAPSTSEAAELVARFGGMGLGRPMPEPPLT